MVIDSVIEALKYTFAALIGGGIAYGSLRAEIAAIKQTLQDHKGHAERLAAIEAKIDFVIKTLQK